MSFFSQFPKTTYDLKRDGNRIEIRDIFRNVDVNEKIIPEASAYQNYYVKDGERPDQVSSKLYGKDSLYWTLFVANDFLKDGYTQWPLSYSEMVRQREEDYDSYVVFELEPESFRKINSYANPISSLSIGVLIGGSYRPMYDSTTNTGAIHRIDSERNQVWIKPGANAALIKNYIANNTATTTINGYTTKFTIELNSEPEEASETSRLQTLGCTNAWAAAWQAPYYYKGTADKRQSIYDALSTSATSNPYTYNEFLEDENEAKRPIRVIKREYITEFAEVYKEYVSS